MQELATLDARTRAQAGNVSFVLMPGRIELIKKWPRLGPALWHKVSHHSRMTVIRGIHPNSNC
jgi:hypothetical protein